MLYKYYPLTPYNLDALKVGYFYFSKAKCLNDPFDMTFGLLSQNIINKLYSDDSQKELASEKMKNYGVCCFSEKWNNNILWAYYANNYSGFVVGYDETLFHKIMDENLVRVPLQKVNYIENGRTRQTLWSAVQMLTQKLCCQTIHDCPKVVPLHYESE